jgi:hypothetical protein
MNSYELSRNWFDWAFENPELVSPTHTAIYFFAIEHCNRLGWKDKFGFPTQMAMDAIGVRKHQTFTKHFTDLVEWGFIGLVQKSKNQYSANIISLKSAKPKNGKALDKALVRHGAKQSQSTGQSKDSIDKQETNEPINKETNTGAIAPNEKQSEKPKTKKPEIPTEEEFMAYYKSELSRQFPGVEFDVKTKYETWVFNDWKDGYGKKITNWKLKLKSTIPHLKAKFDPNRPQPLSGPLAFSSKTINK